MSGEVATIIKSGGIGIFPTDTLYGLVGSAFSKEAVEKIYKIKNRDSKKPLIVLIGDIDELSKFGISLDSATKIALEKFWPGPVSVLLSCPGEKFWYLHRGTNEIAFRVPAIGNSLTIANDTMRNFLRHAGPIVAPSANPEGKPPAQNITEARAYFGEVACPVRSLGNENKNTTKGAEGALSIDVSNGNELSRTSSGVNFYEDAGELSGEPSTLVRLINGHVEVLRQGGGKVV